MEDNGQKIAAEVNISVCICFFCSFTWKKLGRFVFILIAVSDYSEFIFAYLFIMCVFICSILCIIMCDRLYNT